jgi:hypothetical protein
MQKCENTDFLLLAVLVLPYSIFLNVDVFILTAFPSTPGYRHIKTQQNTVVQKSRQPDPSGEKILQGGT